jgi:hypothetical protein
MPLEVDGRRIVRRRSSGGGYRLGTDNGNGDTAPSRRGSLAYREISGGGSTNQDTEQTFSLTSGGEFSETTGGQKVVLREAPRQRPAFARDETRTIGVSSGVTKSSTEITASGAFAEKAYKESRKLQPKIEEDVAFVLATKAKTGGQSTPLEGLRQQGVRMQTVPSVNPIRGKFTPNKPNKVRAFVGRGLEATADRVQGQGVAANVREGAAIGVTSFGLGAVTGATGAVIAARSAKAGAAFAGVTTAAFAGYAAAEVVKSEREQTGINFLNTATGVAGFTSGFSQGAAAPKAVKSALETRRIKAEMNKPVGVTTQFTGGSFGVRSRSVRATVGEVPTDYSPGFMGSMAVAERGNLMSQKTLTFAGAENTQLFEISRPPIRKTLQDVRTLKDIKGRKGRPNFYVDATFSDFQALSTPKGTTKLFSVKPATRTRVRQSINFPQVTGEASFSIINTNPSKATFTRISNPYNYIKGEVPFQAPIIDISLRPIRRGSAPVIERGADFTMSRAAGYERPQRGFQREITDFSFQTGKQGITNPKRLLEGPSERMLFSDPTGGVMSFIASSSRSRGRTKGLEFEPTFGRLRDVEGTGKGRLRGTAKEKLGTDSFARIQPLRARGFLQQTSTTDTGLSIFGVKGGSDIFINTKPSIDSGMDIRTTPRQRQRQTQISGLFFASSLQSASANTVPNTPIPTIFTPGPPGGEPFSPPTPPRRGGLPMAFPLFGLGTGSRKKKGKRAKQAFGYNPSLAAGLFGVSRKQTGVPKRFTGIELRGL